MFSGHACLCSSVAHFVRRVPIGMICVAEMKPFRIMTLPDDCLSEQRLMIPGTEVSCKRFEIWYRKEGLTRHRFALH